MGFSGSSCGLDSAVLFQDRGSNPGWGFHSLGNSDGNAKGQMPYGRRQTAMAEQESKSQIRNLQLVNCNQLQSQIVTRMASEFAPGVGNEATRRAGTEEIFVEMEVKMAVHRNRISDDGTDDVVGSIAATAELNIGFGCVDGPG